jgi:mono/diheme cytochrome c family protein
MLGRLKFFAVATVVLPTIWVSAPALADADGPGYSLPFGDTERGRALFVEKACVVCHAINGVGGKFAPAFDDYAGAAIDPFDFASRMWRGAPMMITLQEMHLGYRIELSGQELADIARFVHNSDAHASFNESEVPQTIRDMMVDEIYDALNLE